ncbi:aminoacyl-tRNA hydrolase [Alkalibaculum sp. M08DMB]|uniref:Peptidyl-tRNA hydrolase n=1 Tax=Alkalibaculum sporogenes TaxID=2655001 RepID=A0A6A7K6H2_9FIRM|nr:aminoacyl-tRNA hydrolase [Alkalibaculum sporogenes]MPW24974.1 aminoacyl-tRNA hydrolase [Alkalibaculum sporogenes]
MKAIVGLGNPGNKYVLTRHNIGFEVIDYLATKYSVNFKSHLKAHIGVLHIDSEKVLLVKPQTYMNLSGESLLEVTSYYDIELQDVLIVYDDIDLDLGKMRIRKHGSAGTHNGMRSIIYNLKSQDIPRLRIGIGKQENIPLANYVLQRFSPDEMPIAKEIVIRAGDGVISFIKDGINLCMNKYNINIIDD